MQVITNKNIYKPERMRKMKKLLSLVLVLALALSLAACGSNTESTDEATTTDGQTKYIVATNPDFQPFEYIDENTQEVVGFDIDLIKAIGEDQGFEVEIQQLGFDAITGAIQSGVVDIGASGMSITEERLETVDFSDPYIDAGLSISVREDDDSIQSVDDLAGKTCAVQIGTTGAAKAQELLDQGVLKEVKVLDKVDVVYQELITKGVDCVINDTPVTKAYISNAGGVKIVGEDLVSDSYGFAVAKGNDELVAKINAGHKNLQENGKYDELIAKYF